MPEVRFVTTLAGYVHWRLTGRKVLGVGDASGMFPIDSATQGLRRAAARPLRRPRRRPLPAAPRGPAARGARRRPGRPATLTAEGAALLDPTGTLRPGVLLCPPEGDAGTGMVATNSVAPRTGNVSAGTSIFAMVVLERPLAARAPRARPRHDPGRRPGRDGALQQRRERARRLGRAVRPVRRRRRARRSTPTPSSRRCFREALDGEADAGGLLAYNHLAGEPIAGLTEGRPLFVRTPDSRLTLANFMRAQLYGVFGTLSLGMRVLADEGVALDRMFAHGGMFRTAGVAQRFLAGALDAPVAVGETASEGGAWGIAVLASLPSRRAETATSARTSSDHVFAGAEFETVDPDPADVAGFAAYLDRYRAGLAVEAAAARRTLTTANSTRHREPKDHS